MNFKRFGRYIACLLLCAVTVSMVTGPVHALSTAGSLLNNDVIPAGPGSTVEDVQPAPEGLRASTVHRSASYGSTEIGCFKDGTKLNVLGTNGKFYKVDCYDMTGYIAQSQVSVNEVGEHYVNCVADSSETKYLTTYSMNDTLNLRSTLLSVAKKYIGVPYVTGGETPNGFDCSGYTKYVFNKAGVPLDRSLFIQLSDSIIVAKEDLQCGDLIIFSYTGRNGRFASHIGIYVGNNQVIHASSSRGVTISDLNDSYYVQHYQCARRIIVAEEAPAVSLPATGIIQSSGGSYWRDNSDPQ